MNKRAFTLIEVMIALVIISITLVALSMSQGLALNSTRKSRFITMATLAAKNMMAEIDISSTIKGFTYITDLGEKTEGQFEDEEYAGWKWVKEVKEIEFPVAAIMKGYTSAKTDEGTLGATEEEKQTDSGEAQILSMIANNVEAFMKKNVREVTVTVMWPVRAGQEFSSLRLVYYAVDSNGIDSFSPVM